MITPISQEAVLSNKQLDTLLNSLKVEHDNGVVEIENVKVNFNSTNETVVRNFIGGFFKVGFEKDPSTNTRFDV
tara:strand:+ start:59 stop:280 length:222 start_codon:yes stop_codon:yes gene_type:complete